MASDRKKFRTVDFTHEEFCKHFGIKERTFTNHLDRFCDDYGFTRLQFKRNEEEGVYFWPAEWAELAGLLFKTLPKNPCFRENVKPERITSKEIRNYYKTLIDTIDNKLPPHIRNAVYTFDSYYDAKLTVAYVPVLEKRIGEIAAFYLEESSETPGDLWRYLSDVADGWIYNLYRNNSMMAAAKKTERDKNIKILEEAEKSAKTYEDLVAIYYDKEELMAEKVKYKPLSLDLDLVRLLKKGIYETEPIQFWGNESYKKWVSFLKHFEDDKDTKKETAQKIKSLLDIEKNSNENNIIVSDLRQTYYEILDDIGFYVKYKDKVKAQSNVESLNKSIASYTTFYDRVLAKTEELSKECKNGDTELLENIKYGNDYKEFADRLGENAKKYEKATQYFLGQLILPQFLNDRKTLK